MHHWKLKKRCDEDCLESNCQTGSWVWHFTALLESSSWAHASVTISSESQLSPAALQFYKHFYRQRNFPQRHSTKNQFVQNTWLKKNKTLKTVFPIHPTHWMLRAKRSPTHEKCYKPWGGRLWWGFSGSPSAGWPPTSWKGQLVGRMREREKNKQQIREMKQARSISEAECYPFILSPQLWWTWRIPTVCPNGWRIEAFAGFFFWELVFILCCARGWTHTQWKGHSWGRRLLVAEEQWLSSRGMVCVTVFQREICGFETEKQEAWKSLL